MGAQKVYVIRSEAGPVKIGISTDPAKRLEALMAQQPYTAEVIHVQEIVGMKASAVEIAAHSLLLAKRRRGEWFDVTTEEAVGAIQEAVSIVEAGLLKPRALPGHRGPPKQFPVRKIVTFPAGTLARIAALCDPGETSMDVIRVALAREIKRRTKARS